MAGQPFDLTLWTYGLLAQGEADDRREERFDLASLVRMALFDADAFRREEDRFRAAIAPMAESWAPVAYPTARREPTQAEILAFYDHAVASRRWVDKDGNPVTVT